VDVGVDWEAGRHTGGYCEVEVQTGGEVRLVSNTHSTMATQTFHSFNASELERNIEKLTETKHTCTFKLNLLRNVAALSPAHLPTFDNLENKLFNIAHQIYELKASGKERKARLSVNI
jgi:hypothetical protein